ncbi:MAG TPA: 5'-methylthioadenosine/adenosylhomocysteine nucleosidase [Burkholderiaceae bacterium]|nr:5'-methylthioadenosine/adenosylhomocysteine nucleosidase [Burkholderiaceae bacterium]HNG81136.1 5'-methylthioadenosine/adenosylhomocysteine nucleosidase [Burkholderiaceae bacterium]
MVDGPATQLARTAHAPTAIVSAMAQELAALLAHHEGDFTPQRHAGRNFHVGRLHGEPVVLVLCGVGKVAAATTTALLAERFGVRQVVFTGVAGGLGPGVRVGDVVLGDTLLQHDMDASPLFPRWEVPLTGRSEFPADAALSEALAQAAAAVLAEPGHYGQAAAGRSTAECDAQARALGVHDPVLHRGLVISGDRFVATAAESQALQTALPAALAVEMEGAAIAQVCHDLGLPFAVLRTISDRADDSAHVDFLRFIEVVAARASAAIVGRWLRAQRAAG